MYFKTFSLNNYPLGDNREFKIEGSHGIDRVMIMLNQKYSYMGPFIPLYKNKQQEVITLDSDELYNKILFEVFNDKFRRDAEVVLYIKPMNATIDQKVFNNLIFKGRPELTSRSCLYSLQYQSAEPCQLQSSCELQMLILRSQLQKKIFLILTRRNYEIP